uniref:PHD-type domain-containing protein n=1 Tax=Aquila chrysaetos chrysaetos TaxID=223781 RepID=A0A663ESJ5_AQUCH
MEQGESKAALPQRSRGLVGAVSVGPRAVAGGGRSSPSTPGQGPSCPQPAGPRLGGGHLLGPPCLQCPLPLPGLQPCPSASSAGAEQALGGNPSGTLPPAPQRCSFPPAFALSPPACLLCRRAEADPALCGDKLEKRGLCAHVFCLVSYLFQRGDREAGLMGFLPEDIRRTIARAAQKHCFVCGESGAAISCWEMGCDRSFHLPCAVEGGCVTQFALRYRYLLSPPGCHPGKEPALLPSKSYGTMVCPACKHAWFHRGCIQVGAHQGLAHAPYCPLCRDKELFLSEMLTMGIRIPFRLVPRARPDNPVLRSLCPHSREPVCFPRPWQLLLCCSCAAEGTHRRCSDLRSSTASWECDACLMSQTLWWGKFCLRQTLHSKEPSSSDTKIKQWPSLQGRRSYSTNDPQAQRLTACSLT